MGKRKSNTGIPGLSFSWKRALGITQAKQKIARQTGIPTTKSGIERKIGKMILKSIFWKKITFSIDLPTCLESYSLYKTV